MTARRPGEPRSAGGKPGKPGPVGRTPGEVRLIGGLWKRSKLRVPDRPGLRPTPERVRETLFNWLGQGLAGWRVIDAFAGSGALGFEAASRGAAEVVLIERDAHLVRGLEAVRARLAAEAVQVVHGDALAWMARCMPRRFDLVLLDPPFGAGLHQAALAAALPLVAPGGMIYVEAAVPLREAPGGFSLWRSLRAGAVHAQLLRRGAAAEAGPADEPD